ncbi:hypothetical protein L210DRAFT_491052 [Boletus edulis BED1]|uniref:Uncharacterized protein n=1 Tax=Boletus edulis BED1 TaxID=1328754 RepID=A0AAD4BY65_BOLED|nr:hypothetical protein L210DRAFT_491052 [Boletus edulis BED1]
MKESLSSKTHHERCYYSTRHSRTDNLGPSGYPTRIHVLVGLSLAVIFVFVTRSAPNKQSLGSMNGLSQNLTFCTCNWTGTDNLVICDFKGVQYPWWQFGLRHLIILTILVVLSRCLPDLEDEE